MKQSGRLRKVGAAVCGWIGWPEIGLGVALCLLAEGARQVWPPGAYLVPGVVLLWMCLPPRRAFFVRPPSARGEE